ncbi:MAG TPA: hypothetical protein VMG10_19205 [Gemmataceae bacterium]|nr:hypothetical protein [Gemmataceae bacterium]
MRPDDLRAVFRRQPFEPVRICLVDGTSYEIRHPDQVSVNRSTLSLAGTVARLPAPLLELEVIIALLHISRLEPLESLSTPAPDPANN